MSKLPSDLQKALARNKKAFAAWNSLTAIAQRDFITWITSAKQKETRAKRIEKAYDMLLSGKRRPCCYAVTPLTLYSALNTSPNAKTTWSTLTPEERRDIVEVIGTGATQAGKIEQVIKQLNKKKPTPQ